MFCPEVNFSIINFGSKDIMALRHRGFKVFQRFSVIVNQSAKELTVSIYKLIKPSELTKYFELKYKGGRL